MKYLILLRYILVSEALRLQVIIIIILYIAKYQIIYLHLLTMLTMLGQMHQNLMQLKKRLIVIDLECEVDI
jgi:hypothetical protein